jgi:hypothetical protein
MGLIICELGFEDEDVNRAGYSMREVDFYALVPYDSQRRYNIKNHRLSLRKNLMTGEFEVYRFYPDEEREEVVFSGDFEDALEFANNECNRYWGHLGRREPDRPCQHKYPIIDRWFCPKRDG